MPIVRCPHCQRPIPFEMHELEIVFECARCGRKFSPLGGPVYDETHPERPMPQGPQAGFTQTTCGICNKKLKIPADAIGKKMQCPKCGGAIAFPDEKSEQPQEAQPDPIRPLNHPSIEVPPKEPYTVPESVRLLRESAASLGGPLSGESSSQQPACESTPKASFGFCANCNARLKIPAALIGEKLWCPKCREPMQVSNEDGSCPTPRPETTGIESAPVATEGIYSLGPLPLQSTAQPPIAESAPASFPTVASDATFATFPDIAGLLRVRSGDTAIPLRRIASPSFSVLTLILLFMPLLEVRCSSGAAVGKPMITQNGYQAIYGGYSVDRQLEIMADKHNNRMAAKMTRQQLARAKAEAEKDRLKVSSAPVMLLFILALFAAIVTGLASVFASVVSPYLGRDWAVVSGVCTAATLLLLSLQMAIGFPIADDLTKAMANNAAKDDEFGIGAALMATMMYETKYTAWMWITWFCLFLSLVSLVWSLSKPNKHLLIADHSFR